MVIHLFALNLRLSGLVSITCEEHGIFVNESSFPIVQKVVNVGIFVLLKALSASALPFVMAHINLYLYNPHQASASYPVSSIDTSINTEADSDADALCDQGLNLKIN